MEQAYRIDIQFSDLREFREKLRHFHNGIYISFDVGLLHPSGSTEHAVRFERLQLLEHSRFVCGAHAYCYVFERLHINASQTKDHDRAKGCIMLSADEHVE